MPTESLPSYFHLWGAPVALPNHHSRVCAFLRQRLWNQSCVGVDEDVYRLEPHEAGVTHEAKARSGAKSTQTAIFVRWAPRRTPHGITRGTPQVPAGMPRRPCKGFRAVWFSPRAGPRFLYVLALRDHGFFFRFRVRGPLGREGSRWCRGRMRKKSANDNM